MVATGDSDLMRRLALRRPFAGVGHREHPMIGFQRNEGQISIKSLTWEFSITRNMRRPIRRQFHAVNSKLEFINADPHEENHRQHSLFPASTCDFCESIMANG